MLQKYNPSSWILLRRAKNETNETAPRLKVTTRCTVQVVYAAAHLSIAITNYDLQVQPLILLAPLTITTKFPMGR